jgi:hypothetical protein
MKTKLSLWVCLVACLFVAASILNAQDYRGRVQGVVMDNSEAVIPGASVSLVNTQTGVAAKQKSNEVGHYIFDYVEPGSYQVEVSAPGFADFVQQNVTVKARGDVTVNTSLKLGAESQRVVVEAAPVDVEFNSAAMATTIDQKMANDLPMLTRNPFVAATLDPGVFSNTTGLTPFNSWAATSMQVGGGSAQSIDVLVDSTPVGLGAKASYTPPMDSVDQLVVQENPVDASYGNSAGSVMQVVMKSGNNDWHGNIWYLGRYPFMQALADRTTRGKNTTRQNMWGGSLGNPIRKNKIFNYFVYEQWKMSAPTSWVGTVPTSLQAAGDFSQTYNRDGNLAVIYDPMTTTFDAISGLGTRTPFAGNKIPSGRMDPVAVRLMKDFFAPNNAGDNITGANNYKSSFSALTAYYNFSDRVDYNISDKWRVYGRVNRFHTIVTDSFPNATAAFVDPDGSARNAFTTSGDAVYTINPETVLNLHGDYNSFVDGYQASKTLDGGYSSIWQNNWYNTFKVDAPTLYPRMVVNGTAFGSPWVYWSDNPYGLSFSGTITKQIARHYLKAGFEDRHQVNKSISYSQNVFNFSPAMTADDFVVSHTNLYGNGYASFLLGAMDSNSTVYTTPHKESHWNSYAAYVQDDFKLNKRLTLNLGLRWEYEAPLTDPQNRLGRYLDLTQPNPTLAANPVTLPTAVDQYRMKGPIFNGVYNFTTSDHRSMYDAPKFELLPRFGLAFRVDDKTAIRFGYGRFLFPFAKSNYNNSLGVAYPGLDASQSPLAPVLGVPQVFLQNPFPSTSPLIPPLGNQYGANYGLGNSMTWFKQNFTPGKYDRFNFSVQRQLPNKMLLDVTVPVNIGSHLPLRYDVNLANPNIYYTAKGTVAAQVANPFYQYATPITFPGTLRNQKTQSIYNLTVPYPQYGSLYYMDDIGGDHYRALQVKVQRPFRDGYNFTFGYNYNREQTKQFFNDLNQYANRLAWREGTQPRHRITAAGIYELPFGHGRKYLNSGMPVLNLIAGGWQLSGSLTYHSGNYLTVGSYQMDGNPAISDPTIKRWFDTTKFHLNPAYTPRSNRYTYPGLTGPRFWDLDLSFAKDFAVYDRVKSQLKMSTYNSTNTLMRADPDMNFTSATFGQALRQASGQSGRQTEIGLKFFF